MSRSTLSKIFQPVNGVEVEQYIKPSYIFDKIANSFNLSLEDDPSFYESIRADFDDFDKRHDDSLESKIYLNDFDFNLASDREQISSLLRTEYDNNNFSTVGSCECGKYRANMYVGSGMKCDECHTEVIKPLSNNFNTIVWLRSPAKVSGFINPAIYHTFFKRLNTRSPKTNIVDYWINENIRNSSPYKSPDSKAFVIAQRLELLKQELGIEFGYNSFIDNCDLIITSLLENDKYKILDIKGNKSSKNDSKHEITAEEMRRYYLEFWNRFKSKATSKYFPVPNKISTIIEADGRSRYFTKEQIELNNQFQLISDLYKEDDERCVENEFIMGKTFEPLVNSLENVLKNVLFGKKGSIRYHAGGGKLPFTGRSVITGISAVGRTDTVILPWEFALTCLDKHLTSWLYRKGFTPVKVKKLIREGYNQVTDIIEEFVNWVEDNNLAIAIVGRNPSIQYLSGRAMFVRFNRDIFDKSIRIPILGTRMWGESNCAPLKSI